MTEDFVQLAADHSRESFVAAFPHPFLLGEGVLRQPRTGRAGGFESGTTVSADEHALLRGELARRMVLPVRKSHVTFPSMITVGRIKNNDIVIADVGISKLHAFFRVVDGGHELADAGSQNGTRVGEHVLTGKGPGVRVHSGDVIHFAQLRFRFLDSAEVWTELRTH